MAHEDVVEAIEAALSPYLGEAMARAATRDQCRRMGLEGGALDGGQVEALLARMGAGLHLFVGRDQASRLVDGVRSRLGAGGAA